MDVKNLSYECIVRYFDEYLNANDSKCHYFCRECKKLEYSGGRDFFGEIHINYREVNGGEKICNECYDEKKHILLQNGKECSTLLQTEDCGTDIVNLSFDEIKEIMLEYTHQGQYTVYFFCEICKKIQTSICDDYFVNAIIDDVEYNVYCGECNVCYPKCCLPYYKYPKSFYEENPKYKDGFELCIACINKKEMVEIKPAKK